MLNRSELHNISVIRLNFDQEPIICVIFYAPTDNYSIEIMSDFDTELNHILVFIPKGENGLLLEISIARKLVLELIIRTI